MDAPPANGEPMNRVSRDITHENSIVNFVFTTYKYSFTQGVNNRTIVNLASINFRLR